MKKTNRRTNQRGSGMFSRPANWVKKKLKTRKRKKTNRMLGDLGNLSYNENKLNRSNYYINSDQSLNKLRSIYEELYKKSVPRYFRNNKKWIRQKIQEKRDKKIHNKSDSKLYLSKIQIISNEVNNLQLLFSQVLSIHTILLNYYEKDQGKEIGKFDVRLLPGGNGGPFSRKAYQTISSIVFDNNYMTSCPGMNLNMVAGRHPYMVLLEFLSGNRDVAEHALLNDISNLILNIGCQLNKRYIFNGPGISLNNSEINSLNSIAHINQCQGSCISHGEDRTRNSLGMGFDHTKGNWSPYENSNDAKKFVDSTLYMSMILKNSIIKICKYYRIEELWILSDITEYGTTFNKLVTPIPPYIYNKYITLFSTEKGNEKMDNTNRVLSDSVFVNNVNTKNTFLKSLLAEWINEIADAEFKDKISNVPNFYQLLKLNNIEDMRCGYCKHNSIGVVINKNFPTESNDDDKINSQLNRNPVSGGMGIGNATIHYYCTNEKCGAFLGCSSGSIDGVLKQTGTAVASSMGLLLKKIMDKTPETKGQIEQIASDIVEKFKTTPPAVSPASPVDPSSPNIPVPDPGNQLVLSV